MKIKNEKGRSMVEMLGVLAVIGALSVGGIAGYTMAMNRYRANEPIDIASKYATIVYTHRQIYMLLNGGLENWKKPTLTSSGFLTSSTVNGTRIEATEATDNGVTIQMTFDDPKICKNVALILGMTVPAVCNTLTYTFKQS